jgi:AmmeMemoRadiSam system protein B
MMFKNSDLRPSPIAGQWYSGNAKQLAASVDQFIDDAENPKFQGEIIAIIAPHAGHYYSGSVAGYAYKAIQGMNPDLVVIISPMHQPYFESILTSGHDAYETPLGFIPIDKKVTNELNSLLNSDLGYGMKSIRNDREHSIEIQLPFLQQSLSDEFSILPIMLRDQSFNVTRTLGITLGKVLKTRKFLLVASTDLSHFYSQETAKTLDHEILMRIENFDPKAVLDAEDIGVGYACGRGAVASVLWATKELGGDQVKILNYGTSGDISHDYQQVVGYGAAVIVKSKG